MAHASVSASTCASAAAICSCSFCGSRFELSAAAVAAGDPSIAAMLSSPLITPSAFSSASTCGNKAVITAWCRLRNSPNALFDGLTPPPITRQPTSSVHAPAISRVDFRFFA